MTDAPERIWALPDCFSNADQDNTEDWTCGDWDTTDNPRSVEYIRADLADRQTQEAVAAALRKAAEVAENAYHHADDGTSDPMSPEGIADRILALITENAQTALTKMLAEAKAEGMREAADKAFSMIDSPWDDYVRATIRAAADAIQKEGGA